MRRFSSMPPDLWRNKDFSRLSDSEKVLYLYLYCGPHIEMSGCCYLPPTYATTDLNWELQQFHKSMDGLMAGHLVIADKDTNEVFVVGFEKHMALSPKHRTGIYNAAAQIKSEKLKEAVLEAAAQRPAKKSSL